MVRVFAHPMDTQVSMNIDLVCSIPRISVALLLRSCLWEHNASPYLMEMLRFFDRHLARASRWFHSCNNGVCSLQCFGVRQNMAENTCSVCIFMSIWIVFHVESCKIVSSFCEAFTHPKQRIIFKYCHQNEFFVALEHRRIMSGNLKHAYECMCDRVVVVMCHFDRNETSCKVAGFAIHGLHK